MKQYTIQTGFTLALLASSAVHAQDAVQWKVSDGGNGHWYTLVTASSRQTWQAASDAANAIHGHLATLATASEDAFIRSVLPPYSDDSGGQAWLGAFQDRTSPDYAEPFNGWKWVTGELMNYQAWTHPASEDNYPGADFLTLAHEEFKPGYFWNDMQTDYLGGRFFSIVEFEADCNNDGIVDYGQCHDGTLPDADGNNIPDCCERGETCLVANYAVQWRTQDGGNGHWYEMVFATNGLFGWRAADRQARSLGGDLANIGSTAENQWIAQTVASDPAGWRGTSDFYGPWLGGFQDRGRPEYSEPDGGWRWANGETWQFTSWGQSLPNNAGEQDFLHYYSPVGGQIAAYWDDVEENFVYPPFGPMVVSSIIEWSADCNNDNIVDYGQCRDGTLLDTNGNNVPDSCEGDHQPIHGYDFQSGVLDQYGAVNGVLVNGASLSNGSLYTDGIDDYVQFPEQIIPTSGPFTVALRFRTTSIPTGWMELISQGCSGCGAFYLGRAPNAQWRYWLDNSEIQTGIPYPADSSWHDVAATYQPDGITKLYVDTQLVAQYSAPPLTATGQPTRLACQFDLQEHHQGYIDVLRIYDVALTAAEIAHLTNSCVGDILVDRIINGADLGALLSYWGPVTSSPVSMSCDLNGDGLVNGGDLGMLLANWGTCPN